MYIVHTMATRACCSAFRKGETVASCPGAVAVDRADPINQRGEKELWSQSEPREHVRAQVNGNSALCEELGCLSEALRER